MRDCMNITLVELRAENECVNKDLAGGYGTRTSVGKSFRAKMLEMVKRKKIRLPSLTLAYLAAILKQKGHRVSFSRGQIKDGIDMVIIVSSIVECNKEIAYGKQLRERGFHVGFVGTFCSKMPEMFMQGADFVIVGEPEHFFFNNFAGEKPTGMILSPNIMELDTLPFPDWSIFNLHEYSYFPQIKAKPFVTVQSSRGCVYSCSFYCPYTAGQGTRWRNRSVKNVIEELIYLKEQFGVKGFLFRDPLFSANKKRVSELADEMIARKLDLRWGCETRLDLLDEKLVDHLYEAGLQSINVGVESSNDDVLKSSQRKPVHIELQERMIAYCENKGINIAAFYIIGLNDDTVDTVEATINYAKKLNTHIAQFTISTPYPGTPFYNEVEQEIYDKNFEHYDAYTPVYRHKNISPEMLLKLKEKAFTSYYFRLKYLFKFLRRMSSSQ